MPKFSILLPTRQRADTLRFALQTAVAQDFDDVEILVHESGDDPRTADVVAEIGDSRTRHLKTGKPVAMKENWERAVGAATGDYLTIIGDDDGILAAACSEAAEVLEKYPVDVLTWRPAAYFWPGSAITALQNRLQAWVPKVSGFELQDPRTLLYLAYHFRDNHYTMPMMLHSFVGRRLVDRVIKSLGSYFSSAAPDIASAVADAWFGESCILSHRPLSISGISHHSTGSRMHFNRDLKLRKEAEQAAFGVDVGFHPSLPNSRNSQIFAANEMMTMKQALFPDKEPSFNYRALIERALKTLETGFEDYESGLGDIRRTAELNGIDMDDFEIPAPRAGGSRPQAGVQRIGDALLVDVDCGDEGLTDVAGATRFLSSVLPPFEPPRDVPEPPIQLGVISRPFPPGGLRFSWDGNSLILLGSGWGCNEAWGVWTVGKKADLTLHLEPGLDPFKLVVSGRMFMHQRALKARGRALINGRCAAYLTATENQTSVDFCVDVTRKDLKTGTLLLEFCIDAPTSPAEAGISADVRSLGFGLEQILFQ